MLGISTSWLSDKTANSREIIARILALGVKAVELEYRINHDTYSQIRPLLKKNEMTVLTVHNFFPVPPMLSKGSGDAFLFTSDDEDDRKLAVEYATRTIEHACNLEARAAVLHLGSVPLRSDLDRLYELYDQDQYEQEEAILLREHLVEERREKADKYLDRVLLCLDKLLQVAERLNVTLGIETRYHYHEIPSFEEVGKILKKFAGAPVAYWHDAGHAHNIESLGFSGGRSYLDTYSSEMAGVHLHDAKGREDHFAPGTGDIDFAAIKARLNDKTINIVEVHPKVTSNELAKSLEFLEDLGIS